MRVTIHSDQHRSKLSKQLKKKPLKSGFFSSIAYSNIPQNRQKRLKTPDGRGKTATGRGEKISLLPATDLMPSGFTRPAGVAGVNFKSLCIRVNT
jgi:hypothetical protein